MRNYHDLGGKPAGPIDRKDHEPALWEKRIEAMLVILSRKGMLTIDENRRALESLGADVYLNASYAERRIRALATNLLHKGVITVDGLARKLAEVDQRRELLP